MDKARDKDASKEREAHEREMKNRRVARKNDDDLYMSTPPESTDRKDTYRKLKRKNRMDTNTTVDAFNRQSKNMESEPYDEDEPTLPTPNPPAQTRSRSRSQSRSNPPVNRKRRSITDSKPKKPSVGQRIAHIR